MFSQLSKTSKMLSKLLLTRKLCWFKVQLTKTHRKMTLFQENQFPAYGFQWGDNYGLLEHSVGLCKPIFGFVCVLIDLYLRAQEELGARDTRIRQPLTWSSRKIKKFGKIFFRKNILSSSMLIAFRENPKIWRIFWSLSYRDCYQKCSNWWFSGISDYFFVREISETMHPGPEQTLLAW